MSDTSDRREIDEHEDLDADTIYEDTKELFEPDNTQRPLQPDDPPSDDDESTD